MQFHPQRIRDPLHNLITFQANEFEHVMWCVIQTQAFQRLRRIKQLGFSEFVYPGATHSRFAHSLGVFHVARRLMTIIKDHLGRDRYLETRAHQAIAASLCMTSAMDLSATYSKKWDAD
jgi:HD superfamily phosphohydrolase